MSRASLSRAFILHTPTQAVDSMIIDCRLNVALRERLFDAVVRELQEWWENVTVNKSTL